jgi:hypothetical protein
MNPEPFRIGEEVLVQRATRLPWVESQVFPGRVLRYRHTQTLNIQVEYVGAQGYTHRAWVNADRILPRQEAVRAV